MPLSRRYTPSHPSGEICTFGMDFSFVIPVGVGIQRGQLTIWTNTVPPALSNDFTIPPVSVLGRTLYAQVTGGVDGTDYQFRWIATDTDGNAWPRTALCLCSQTS